MRGWTASVTVVLLALSGAEAAAAVRVQDIAHLQGQRTNKLTGFGLVIGLDGTGDGGKSVPTLNALMALHQRFHQPIIDPQQLKDVKNVARVMVEVTVPEFGAREGQTLDVVVSALSAKSLKGGQLLTTPLQYAMFDAEDPATQAIFALAGGRVQLPDADVPTRGIIRDGATLEGDFLYGFIQDEAITLVLNDEQAGFPLAQMVARAINHELADPQTGGLVERDEQGVLVVRTEAAVALGPKNVRVQIPTYELARPAAFISRVLETPLFMMPKQPARVVINRTTKNISFTGAVTISPTVLQIPGLGTVTIGGGSTAPPAGVIGLDTDKVAGVEFQELLDTLTRIQVLPQQMVEAVEHLHHTGTLHAQLIYTE
jgi:flagellar P-ring protein precursor FlgI